MKKRALSLLLVFVMALGLAVPALAAAPEAPAGLEEPEAPVEAVAEEPVPAAIAPITAEVPAPAAAGSESVKVQGVDGMTFTVAGVEDQNKTAAAVTDAVKHGFWGHGTGELGLDEAYSVEKVDESAEIEIKDYYSCKNEYGHWTDEVRHIYKFSPKSAASIPETLSITLKYTPDAAPTPVEVKYEGDLSAGMFNGLTHLCPGEEVWFNASSLEGDALAFTVDGNESDVEVKPHGDGNYEVKVKEGSITTNTLTVSRKSGVKITYTGEDAGIYGTKLEKAAPGETVTVEIRRGFTLSAVKNAEIQENYTYAYVDFETKEVVIGYKVKISDEAPDVEFNIGKDTPFGKLQKDSGVTSVGYLYELWDERTETNVTYIVPITELYKTDPLENLFVTVRQGFVMVDTNEDNYYVNRVTDEGYYVMPLLDEFDGTDDVLYIKTKRPVSFLLLIDEGSQEHISFQYASGEKINSGTRIQEGQLIRYTIEDGFEPDLTFIGHQAKIEYNWEHYEDNEFCVVDATDDTILKAYARSKEDVKSIPVEYKNESEAKDRITKDSYLMTYDGELMKSIPIESEDMSFHVTVKDGYVLEVEGGFCKLQKQEKDENGAITWRYSVRVDQGAEKLTVNVREAEDITLTWEGDCVKELTVAEVEVENNGKVNENELMGASAERKIVCKIPLNYKTQNTAECKWTGPIGANEDVLSYYLELSDENGNKTIEIKAVDPDTLDNVKVTITGTEAGFRGGEYTFTQEGGSLSGGIGFTENTVPNGSELTIYLNPGYVLQENKTFETRVDSIDGDIYNEFSGMVVNGDGTYHVIASDEANVTAVHVTVSDPNGYIKSKVLDGKEGDPGNKFYMNSKGTVTVVVPAEVELTVDGGTKTVTTSGDKDTYVITPSGAKEMAIKAALKSEYAPPSPPPSSSGDSGSSRPSPSPSPSPSTSPSPSPSPSPTPGGDKPAVPVDPPKTNGGTGWSYDYDTGEWYFFKKGEVVANYWVGKIDGASQWDKNWYYVGADGKMLTGMQYIDDLHGGYGWYYLQPTNDHGEVGKMLTGWQWVGGQYGECYFSAKSGSSGKCTWSEKLGDWTGAAWSK